MSSKPRHPPADLDAVPTPPAPPQAAMEEGLPPPRAPAPSLGRIVLVQLTRPQPFPAIVTELLPDARIAVELFGTDNGSHLATVTYDPDSAPGTWRWPPRV